MNDFSEEQVTYMNLALSLAHRGLYTTMPNPRVGCVIVKAGRCVGQGWHQCAGDHHAEQYALKEAGEQAKQATVYITLEPCSHWNKTPPCVEALIQAQVKMVIISMIDPNPKVSGRGVQRLLEAGIIVHVGLLSDQARLLNIGFIKRMTTGYPWVRCKMAMSLDARTAMSSGESKWITGQESRIDAQQLRGRSCAIMTGIGTIQADNPALTFRLPTENHSNRQPARVILDTSHQLLPSSNLLHQSGAVWWVSSRPFEGGLSKFKQKMLDFSLKQTASVAPPSPIEEIICATPDFKIDLKTLLFQLGQRECNEILLESGPRLAGSMLQLDLIDEFWIYIAPIIMGSSARPLFELDLQQLSQRKNINIQEVTKLGDDLRVVAMKS